MVDYYSILLKAVNVSIHTTTSSKNRNAIYQRSLSALIRQLRQLEAVVPEEQIRSEFLRLAEAIEKVERQFPATPGKEESGQTPALVEPEQERG